MKKIMSILLTMLMLVSVICIAPVSTSAAEVETAQTGVTMTGGEVLYLIPSSNWNEAGARFAAYFFGTGNAWTSMTAVEGEDNLYEVTVPTGSWTNVIFCRMNPGATTNSWENKWNQSADLTFDGTNNCWANAEGSWDGSTGTWSVYTPPVVEEPITITVYFADTRNWGHCSPIYMGVVDRIYLESTYVETNENGIDIYSFDVSFYDYEYGNSGIAIFSFPEETDYIDLDMLYDGACIYVTDEIAFDYGESIAYRVTISPYVPTPTPEPDPEPEVPANPCTVYYVDYADNFTEVYAYAWSVTTKPESTDDEVSEIAAEWPGVKMELTGEALSENAEQAGGLVYSVTFDKAYDYIIFSGTDADGASMGQTADLTFEADKYCYWGNEAWYDSIADIEADYPVAGDDPEEPDGEFITVYFQNNWLWTDVCCYYEGSAYSECSSWPGISMDFFDNDGNYDVYSAVVPADASFIIFNGIKDDGSGDRDQTPNIEEGFYDGICYYMMWDNGNTFGSTDITVLFPEMGGSEGGEGGSEVEPTGSSLEGLSVTLGGKIGYNLHFRISSDIMADPSARLVVYHNDEPWLEIPVTEYDRYDEEKDLYVFTVELAAKEMADRIASKVITDSYNTFFNVNSLAGYCDRILEDPVKYAREQDLVKAMLNYGAASQVYFGYGTDYLANCTLSEADKTVTVYDFSAFAPAIEGEADGVEFYGAALILESDTYLKFYFKIDETKLPEGVVPSININGYPGARLERNGNLWSIVMPSLGAHELPTEFVLAMGNGHSVTYSALSYIYTAQQSGKTELVNLANALGAYSYAAGLYGTE